MKIRCTDNLPLFGNNNRQLYEKIPEEEEEEEEATVEKSSTTKSLCKAPTLFLLWSALVLLLCILLAWQHGVFPSWWWPIAAGVQVPVTHHEKIPTFLSVRNDQTGDFLYALDNQLYDEIKRATFRHDPDMRTRMSTAFPSVSVEVSMTTPTAPSVRSSQQRQRNGQAVTLKWSSPLTSPRSRSEVKLSDIWILYCGNANTTDEQLWQYNNIYEAATVAQIQLTTTSSNDDGVGDHETSTSSSQSVSSWHIPDFPAWHRQEICQFVLYQRQANAAVKSAPQYQKLAHSSRLDFRHTVTTPSNLHLALTHNPTEMTIQFTSTQGSPIVAYATAMNPSKWIQGHVEGTTQTYEASDLCMAPANETGPGKFQSPGLLHTVVLQELQPNIRYVYKAGIQHGQGVTWSDTATFVTAPETDDTTVYPFTYLVYADQGCPVNGWTQGAAYTAAVMTQEFDENNDLRPRMVHHFGDLSYAQGAAHQWDAWHAMIEPISRRVPYHVGIGNHEYDYTAGGQGKDPSGNDEGYHPVWGNFHDDSGGECGVPTSRRFQMPDSPGGVFWYAHNFANLHTIVLSSEHDLQPGSLQYKWLAHDLARINRTATPWVVVETHRPLYEGEAEWEQNDVGIALRMEVENLFRDYDVDLVLAGHYHAYHRTCDGLYRGRCDHGGPMHITVGTAGAHLDEVDLYDNPWSATFLKQVYGYGRITVHNATALHFEFVQGAASENDPEAGQVLDSVWIYRNR